MALVAHMTAQGITISSVDAHRVEARRGSQAEIRLKGGWLSSISVFPAVLVIEFRHDTAGPVADIAAYSEFVGLLTGMKGKYSKALEDFISIAERAIAGS